MDTGSRLPFKRRLKIAAALAAGALAGLGAYIYSGQYNIAADEPHWFTTAKIIETLRDRSIDRRARDIIIPDLEDSRLVLKGAGQYGAMCVGCHLAPGMDNSEIRQGLYPEPPDFSRARIDPARAFWVIKHGIKLTAMPAWGKTHDDQLIWDMVAFIRQLPKLNAAQYQAAVASAPESHEEMMEHMAGEKYDTASEPHEHADHPRKGMGSGKK